MREGGIIPYYVTQVLFVEMEILGKLRLNRNLLI